MMRDDVFIGLGSNLGDRLAHLRRATRLLETSGVEILAGSAVYETEPVDLREQPPFLNQVYRVRTGLDPFDLLTCCKRIEGFLGRTAGPPKGPRVIDLDILFYGRRKITAPELILPHPALSRRRFVLVPLCELAPDFEDCRSGLTIRELLANCPDRSWVRPYA
ncbi:MAG: 2-amino-4-hydroxy-6-hydroxymethyldihydropteridine diphosphokinase [Acidobacteriota bacterium]